MTSTIVGMKNEREGMICITCGHGPMQLVKKSDSLWLCRNIFGAEHYMSADSLLRRADPVYLEKFITDSEARGMPVGLASEWLEQAKAAGRRVSWLGGPDGALLPCVECGQLTRYWDKAEGQALCKHCAVFGGEG